MGDASGVRLEVADLEGWEADDHDAALAAFRRTARRHLERPLRSRPASPLGDFDRVAEASLTANDARAFFERHFEPRRLGAGKLTAYYEPQILASRTRRPGFETPLHARPPELVDLPDPDMRYGRLVDGKPQPYHDRDDIQRGALDGRGLEIAWLRDAVDAFIVHVQGSARMAMTDGTRMRVTYAAKSGHPYTSLGAQLLQRLRSKNPDVSATDITADLLTTWMRSHPETLPDFLALNRSYIFFEASETEAADGPVAAAKVSLTGGRSLAVDRTLHSFGVPFWVTTQRPLPGESSGLRRLTVAQDTGSAIVGTARGDLFVGSGDVAGSIAGAVNHAAEFTALLPVARP